MTYSLGDNLPLPFLTIAALNLHDALDPMADAGIMQLVHTTHISGGDPLMRRAHRRQAEFPERLAAKTKRGSRCRARTRTSSLTKPARPASKRAGSSYGNLARLQPVDNLPKVGGHSTRKFTEQRACATDGIGSGQSR